LAIFSNLNAYNLSRSFAATGNGELLAQRPAFGPNGNIALNCHLMLHPIVAL
jgi:hypothetical protein